MFETTPHEDPEGFELMLEDLDERIRAFVMSERYAAALTPGQWAALRAVTSRNGIPLVIEAARGEDSAPTARAA